MPASKPKSELSPARARVYRVVRRRWLRELLFEEWTLKLIALAITLGLWLGVTAQRAPAAKLMRGVALTFLLPENMVISNDPREQVEVTLSGEKNALEELIASNLVVTADVSGYREGERVARLTPENVTMNVPEGVRVVRVEPNAVPLRLEQRIERQIEVAARLEGAPVEGFVVRTVEITPGRVTVRGPASNVERLERVPTETISLDGRRESFIARSIAVDIEDEQIVALDGIVSVQVTIEEETAERRFTNVAAQIQASNAGEAQPAQPVVVVLRGARSVIEKLTAENLRVVWQTPDGASDGASDALVPRVILPPDAAGRVEPLAVEPARLMRRK